MPEEPTGQRDETLKAIDAAKEQLKEQLTPAIIAAAAVFDILNENDVVIQKVAKGVGELHKKMFDGLVAAGFTEDQAIQIVSRQDPPFQPKG